MPVVEMSGLQIASLSNVLQNITVIQTTYNLMNLLHFMYLLYLNELNELELNTAIPVKKRTVYAICIFFFTHLTTGCDSWHHTDGVAVITKEWRPPHSIF